MSSQTADKPSPIARRETSLRRAYQRALGRKPTLFQRSLIDTAAFAQTRFEFAAANPDTSHNDFVRLSGEARRARTDMLEAFQTTIADRSTDGAFGSTQALDLLRDSSKQCSPCQRHDGDLDRLGRMRLAA
jgi:hypothetical protein